MKLKLKESPREWQKFAAVLALLAMAVMAGLVRRHWVGLAGLWIAGTAGALWIFASLLWPPAFRGVYRAGMTFSFQIGRVTSMVLLTVIFLFFVTPLGWVLRIFGHDLLRLKRDSSVETHWKPARCSNEFDRLF